MPDLTIGGATSVAESGRKADKPERVRDAARQFEALLVGQMLRSIREGGAGWLGTGQDASGECATDFAEQKFAEALASQGGLGLAGMVTAGLKDRK